MNGLLFFFSVKTKCISKPKRQRLQFLSPHVQLPKFTFHKPLAINQLVVSATTANAENLMKTFIFMLFSIVKLQIQILRIIISRTKAANSKITNKTRYRLWFILQPPVSNSLHCRYHH